MKKSDSEMAIVAELRKLFAGKNVGAMGGMVEYQKLTKERPDLFDFQCVGDRWQVVQGWIKKHRLLEK